MSEINKGSGVMNPKFAQKVAKLSEKRFPGIVVGEIAILAEQDKGRKYNPNKILWTVERNRKDYRMVLAQGERKGSLSRYGQHLFDSCFKNWGTSK